jgi:hypothetical protein
MVLVGSMVPAFMYVGPARLKHVLLSFWIPHILCSELNERIGPEHEKLLANCTGRVLYVVGSGGGVYMQYLQQVTTITALEPALEPALNQP